MTTVVGGTRTWRRNVTSQSFMPRLFLSSASTPRIKKQKKWDREPERVQASIRTSYIHYIRGFEYSPRYVQQNVSYVEYSQRRIRTRRRRRRRRRSRRRRASDGLLQRQYLTEYTGRAYAAHVPTQGRALAGALNAFC